MLYGFLREDTYKNVMSVWVSSPDLPLLQLCDTITRTITDDGAKRLLPFVPHNVENIAQKQLGRAIIN